MATVSPFDSFLASLDSHIQNSKAPETPVAGPSTFGRRKLVAEVEQPEESTRLALSPLERALYYEVETRRRQLRRRQKELDFWQAYEQGDLQYKVPSNSTELAAQIKEKRRRLEDLQGGDNLKIESSKALDAAASIQKTLSTTSSSLNKKTDAATEDKQYATTRQLLDDRDDKALEFLRVYNEIRAIRAQRQQIKAKIRDERHETATLLQSIKTLKSDIATRQLNPSSDPDMSQDTTIAAQVKRLHAKIAEARSKLELVKGIIRGLVLESGKDWTKNRETRELMLSLDDDDDASDDAFSDEEVEDMAEMDVDDDQDNDDVEDDS